MGGVGAAHFPFYPTVRIARVAATPDPSKLLPIVPSMNDNDSPCSDRTQALARFSGPKAGGGVKSRALSLNPDHAGNCVEPNTCVCHGLSLTGGRTKL